MDGVILIVALIAIAVIINIIILKSSSKKTKEWNEQIDEDRAVQEAYNKQLQELSSQHGALTITIPLKGKEYKETQIVDHIYAFEEAQVVVIEGLPIPFNKILAYNVTDNQQTVTTTEGHGDTSTSTGSMIGRAVVGGVLLGGVGALAGANTAKKNTTIDTTTTHTTTHDYVIYLNVADMTNPQRILKFGEDEESANKAISIFNIIIAQNNK